MRGRVRIRLGRPSPATVLSLVALVMATSGLAVAAIPGSGGRIVGCSHKRTGVVRLVDAERKCRRTEHVVTWNEQGVPGPAGNQGAEGARGEQGPKGDTGSRGPTGPKGETGTRGPEGPQGIPGTAAAKGDPGPMGPTGPKGDTGPAGPVGPQGVKGDTGSKGETGATGPIGPVGAAGPRGPQGLTGPIGPVGPAGPKGDTGAAGAVGPIGPPGLPGPAGPAGAIGPAGPTGPRGATGATGATGPAGPAGPAGFAALTSVVNVCGDNSEGQQTACEAYCPNGQHVLGGGGMGLGDYAEHQNVNASFPVVDDGTTADESVPPSGWIVWVNNEPDTAPRSDVTVKVWVVCAAAASVTQVVAG